MEMRGIEPRAFHMQSERSTTELHPRLLTGSNLPDLLPLKSWNAPISAIKTSV